MIHGTYDLNEFGAHGDGTTDNTSAFNLAISKINENGGGELIVTPGNYLTGPLKLCSNLTLTIQAGATLSFLPNPKAYPIVNSRWEGAEQLVYQACLYGYQLKNITIQGNGVINGNGRNWWQWFHDGTLEYPRPYLLSLESCVHLKIRDLTFINSPAWTLHPMECNDVLIDGVTVKNPKDSPNTDGLDPESCLNLRIVNCLFDVGDDCIAIKSGTEATACKNACENIVIANCNMIHGHGGVVLGSEMSGDIRNVVITNCTFDHTDRGIRMKTRRGRGGTVENITVNNITMTHTLCPLVINAYYYCGPAGDEKYVWDKSSYPVDFRTPHYRRLVFSNIIATDVQSAAGFIYGLPEAPVEDLQVANCQFFMNPQADPSEPAMIASAPALAHVGFFIENTLNTRLSEVTVHDQTGNIFYRQKNNQNLSTHNVQ